MDVAAIDHRKRRKWEEKEDSYRSTVVTVLSLPGEDKK